LIGERQAGADRPESGLSSHALLTSMLHAAAPIVPVELQVTCSRLAREATTDFMALRISTGGIVIDLVEA